MKQLFLIIQLLCIWSCGSRYSEESNSDKNISRKPIDLEYVKTQLCYQNIFCKEDTIRCPDSIWTVQLKDTSLYLTQSYYGSGYGNGIWVNLIRLEKYSYSILDSIFWCNADDMFKPENIDYNDSLNWFCYIEEGGGTNHYSETKYLIRAENNQLTELISIPLYVSDMDPEVSPVTYTSLKTTEIEVTQQRIVLKARFEAGVEKNGKLKPLRIKEDVATFEYSDSSNSYIWKNSTNMTFKELWTGKNGYDWL